MSNQLVTKNKGMSANVIKYIAIVAMLIDHIAWAFVDTASPLGQVMHIIGRITAPTMCFFIAEGYYMTRNLKTYAGRLAVFSIFSYFAFSFFETGNFVKLANCGMIFTLLLGLIALIICKNDKIELYTKIFIVAVLCGLSIMGDWPIFGVLYVLAFGLNHSNFKKQILWFSMI